MRLVYQLSPQCPCLLHPFAACREIQLVGQLLYHTMTTGLGLETLGEEYCNMLQVTGAPEVAYILQAFIRLFCRC